ncbi:MAG: ATP-grasp domain-containing protein, partial [Ulvibacter sp.]|nr:ATP-grasp domain-containing protein [Ulvibacter sp.]
PIGHRQERGDYQESWQPALMQEQHLKIAQEMAKKVTKALSGNGIWGVEFFISNKNGVYFSELSPRPHDTGMVTLANTQNFFEFELHLRAILGLPIAEVTLERTGASAVLLASKNSENPSFENLDVLASTPKTDFRLFGKPTSRPYRRMGVVVCYDTIHSDVTAITQKAKELAQKVKVLP